MQVQPWDRDLSTADLKITLCTKFNVRLGMHDMVICTYCKSRIFRMHFIFIYFVRGGFHTKIKCMLNIPSKPENPQRSAAVRKFHAYERSGVPRIRKFSAYEIFWNYSALVEYLCA